MNEDIPLLHDAVQRRKVVALACTVGVVSVLTLAFFLGGGKRQTENESHANTEHVIGKVEAGALVERDLNGTAESWTDMPSVPVNDNGPATELAQTAESKMVGDMSASTSEASVSKQDAITPPLAKEAGQGALPAAAGGASSSLLGASAGAASAQTASGSVSPQSFAQATAGLADMGVNSAQLSVPAHAADAQKNSSASDAAAASTTAARSVQPPSVSEQQARTRVAANTRNPAHAEPVPVFVRPAVSRPGVVAQTRSLITERQLAPRQATTLSEQEDPLAVSATAAAAPAMVSQKILEPQSAVSAPARVTQREARVFAERTHRQLREDGSIKPSERVRLPSRAEAPNINIWHEEDVPNLAAAEERRPFGLLLVEELPATTATGIPLRTDIPAGTSPLQKTGPDKPLWKRPE